MMTRRELLKSILASAAIPLIAKTYAQDHQIRKRRDVTLMETSDPFFSDYAEAIKKMHELPESDPRSWRNQAIIHANYCPHGMADFLEWHRFYITYFETICGELIGNNSFALPYWNWSNNEGKLPEPFFKENPLNVKYLNDPSNYDTPSWSKSNWGRVDTVGDRALTADEGLGRDQRFSMIFSENAIDELKRITNYSRFRSMLEGSPHNAAHVLAGNPNGHMINGLSPLDPIFWLHHCNVDRIWAEWQAADNRMTSNDTAYDEQFVNSVGDSVNVVANQSHDYNALGFTYETIDTPIAPRMRTLDLPEKQMEVANGLIEGEEISLGIHRNDQKSIVDAVTNMHIKTKGLAAGLFSRRTFKATTLLSAPRNAVEQSRILAILKGVTYPSRGDERIIVNIFLDCPYLSSSTPSTDPHYAGAFAFFGQPMKDKVNGGEFVVDISNATRYLAAQGRLRQEGLNLQLMPVTIDEDGPKEAEFKVSTVEVLQV